MKVREIEMILADMGAIDPENPEESLGKNRSLQMYLMPFIFYRCNSNDFNFQRTSTEQLIWESFKSIYQKSKK